MYLNHTHKFIFIHVPKTGGIAVRAHLQQNGIENHGRALIKRFIDAPECNGNKNAAENRVLHLPATAVQQYYEVEFSNYNKFGVIRNPYDRFISAFYYRTLMFMSKEEAQKTFGSYTIERTRNIIKKQFIPKYIDKQLRKQLMFESSYIYSVTPQHVFLCDENGKLVVDDIYYTEKLNDEIKAIVQKLKLNISTEINAKNVGFKPNFDKKLLLDDEIKEKVYNFYKKDFEIFNFSKEYSV